MYVYPSATHSRFEHSLGVAHLANSFMNHIIFTQPELNVKPEWSQSVVIAGLCHDLGHGPWSHTFESLSRRFSSEMDHEALSVDILRRIVANHNLDLPPDIIEAAGHFIMGMEHPGFPAWLSQIIANHSDDIDLDKFDYLARDINRSFSIARFEYDRLMLQCRVVEGQLAWKFSEIHTIERLFYNRNDMRRRVYCHRVVQSIDCMLLDTLELANPYLNLSAAFDDLDTYLKWDDRLLGMIEAGEGGEDALALIRRLHERNLYKCVGELQFKPDAQGRTLSQISETKLAEDIAAAGGISSDFLRVVKTSFRFGVRKHSHPLLHVALWKPDCDKIVKLSEEDLSCIVPVHFSEIIMRVFVTENDLSASAKSGFEAWKAQYE
jgi:HD superfamily phosphohydrolase